MHRRATLVVPLASLFLALALAAGCTQSAEQPAPPLPSGASTAALEPRPPASVEPTVAPPPESPLTFAVIGDYGMDDRHERAVARLVASWDPAFVITTGDDYYKVAGGRGTGRYDESTGAYYGRWLKDITTTGDRHPVGTAEVNAFFPSMGNHEYSDATPAPKTYLTYFRLPGRDFTNSSGNERYYDFVQGPIHFFALNSNHQEPDGTSRTSRQARWLKKRLAASTSEWNIVYDHHAPYSSDSKYGAHRYMQWPYAEWGADVVLSGHAHVYERIERGGVVYFVNGLGGARRYEFGPTVKGSKKRYRDNWGAQRVTASETALEFRFYDVKGKLVDRYRLDADESSN